MKEMRKFLIKLIGNKKKKEFRIENIKRVLILGGRVGDIIVKTPLLSTLSNVNKEIKIDVIVEKGAESLLWNHPNVNYIIIEEKNKSKLKIFRITQEIIKAINTYDEGPNFVLIRAEDERNSEKRASFWEKVKAVGREIF